MAVEGGDMGMNALPCKAWSGQFGFSGWLEYASAAYEPGHRTGQIIKGLVKVLGAPDSGHIVGPHMLDHLRLRASLLQFPPEGRAFRGPQGSIRHRPFGAFRFPPSQKELRMSDNTSTPGFDLQDLELDLSDLTVTSMRDTAALPEGGASWGSCSCQGSSSCAQPQPETPLAAG